jgi:mono/diheme cytochrome c family protein
VTGVHPAIRIHTPAILLFCFWINGDVLSQNASKSAAPSFEKQVLPILSRSCVQCHGAAVKQAGLDLRTPASILAGGKGPVVVKGSPEKSLIFQRISDGTMPLGGKKLPGGDIEAVRAWIESGAPGLETAPAQAGGKKSGHWAFLPPVRPTVPSVKQTAWLRTPIDAFVLAELEKRGIRAPRAADPSTLVRRAYFSLIGLPPSPEQRKTFVDSRRPDEWNRLTDDLLARPQYGEHWARHWLDVVRYAESNGYERDGTKPNAWRYRDYVIDAFNRNKPFDRFLTEQIAGDEVDGSNSETQIATTFLRLGTWDDEPAEAMLDRYDQLDDVLGATSAAFLGVTLRCARCHDHKFEPFSQKDYYRTLAVFDPLKRPQNDRIELDRLTGTESELAAYQAAMTRADEEIAPLQKQLDELKSALLKKLFASKNAAPADLSFPELAETVAAIQRPADKRTKEQQDLVKKYEERLGRELRAHASPEENTQQDEWTARIAATNKARPKEPPRGYVWYEEGPRPPATHLLIRGNPVIPGDEVQPGVPAVFGSVELDAPKSTAKSSGRRLWLAKWMTRPDNPLVARVMVNRIWQWHFGEGLVASENDFGVMGQRPTHPELLDYLATELISSGWDIKHIQRLIVNSSTWRAAAGGDEHAAKVDPEESLLWRWRPRRLNAETVRDSMLAVSGQLNPEMHGPSVFPKLPRAVLEGQSKPGDGWGESDDRQSSRRSVYIFAKRSLAVPELEVLDAPDTTASCEQRSVSVTGPQALTFLNGEFSNRQAGYLADRLMREAGAKVEAQIVRAFELVTSRAPSAEELRTGVDFLAKHQRQIEQDAAPKPGSDDARRKALLAFCLVLLNSNEFVYLN